MLKINRRDFIKIAVAVVVAPEILTEAVKPVSDNKFYGKFSNIKTTAKTPLHFDEDKLIDILNKMEVNKHPFNPDMFPGLAGRYNL